MSAIGQYVHFTAYGYAHFGTNRMKDGTKQNHDYTNIINNQRNKIRQEMQSKLSILNPDEKRKIEQSISSLMVSDSKEAKKKGIAEAWEIICKQLEIDFYDTVANDVVTRTGNVQIKGVKINKNVVKGNFLSTYLNSIKQINSLMNQIKNIAIQKEIQNNLNRIEQQIINSQNIAKSDIYNFFNSNQKAREFLEQKNIKDKIISNQEGENIRDLINETANILKGLTSYVKGQMFEMLVAIAADRIGKKAKIKAGEAAQSIKSHWIGNQKTAVSFKPSNFAQGIDMEKILGKKYSFNEDLQSYVASRPTQDKIDVTFQYHGKQIDASLKNVNLYSYPTVSLVDEASFLALLQSIDYDFVNHYLNIMSCHYTMPPSESSNVINFTGQKNMYNEFKMTMSLSLLLSAFIGHKLDVNTANVFIINNIGASKKDSKVKVYNIGELIQRAVENHNLITISGLQEGLYLNSYASTVEERLTTLLSQLHAQKIQISIKKEAFSEMVH